MKLVPLEKWDFYKAVQTTENEGEKAMQVAPVSGDDKQVQLKGLESRRFLVLLVKIAAASLALIAVCAGSSHWLLARWQSQAFMVNLATLFGTIMVGALGFAGCDVLLHIE